LRNERWNLKKKFSRKKRVWMSVFEKLKRAEIIMEVCGTLSG